MTKSGGKGQPGPRPKAAKSGHLPAHATIPFVPPQLATLCDSPPLGDQWFHELKFDGFRLLCRIQDGNVTLFTRTGQDWTARFEEVAEAAAQLGVTGALLDGEVAVLRPDGTTSFQALQTHLQGQSKDDLIYFAFDLLFLDGVDLRQRKLEERKAALAAILRKGLPGVLRYTDHIVGNGPAFFEKAAAAGLEGIISKRRDEPYRGGRGPSWRKIKAIKRQEFVIGGFTEPEGSRAAIGALLVGLFRNKDLVYAGKVGTGFSETVAIDLRRRLDRLVVARSPFQSSIDADGRQIRWVKPELVAEIAYAEMTRDGRVRHPSFQGLREDRPASEVVLEIPQSNQAAQAKPPRSVPGNRAAKPAAQENGPIAGVRMSHPERLLEEKARVTKRDLAEYYALVAPYILPHLEGRPLSLVRCPEGMAGKCFFMKHAAFATPWLRRVTIKEKEEKGEYLIADSVSGLIALAQMSVLEVHTWNSVERTLEMPDRVVFDFDPGPQARWQDVVDGAMLVKKRVEEIGCATFVKTTGGKGLHVVVPLTPAASWDECKVFSQLVSESVVAQHPGRYTTAMRKVGREDKVLIDYFRNIRGSTSVSVYSTRARPGIPVSVPLAWDELASFSPERPFTIASTLNRVKAGYRDPWQKYDASRVDLKDVIFKGHGPRGRASRRSRP
jgi:bifunctional non-homologous end joining protein LigD